VETAGITINLSVMMAMLIIHSKDTMTGKYINNSTLFKIILIKIINNSCSWNWDGYAITSGCLVDAGYDCRYEDWFSRSACNEICGDGLNYGV